jgi:hypothetical protein
MEGQVEAGRTPVRPMVPPADVKTAIGRGREKTTVSSKDSALFRHQSEKNASDHR